MIKETITFKNFNGEEETKDFYFNISKSDLLEFGLREKLISNVEALQNTSDPSEVYTLFKSLTAMCIGRKSSDGRLFIKDQDTRDDFFFSGAYDEFIFDILNNQEKASAFVNKVIPQDLREELTKK